MITGNKNKQKPSSVTPTTAETETPKEALKPKKHFLGVDTNSSKVAEDHQKHLHVLPRPEG